MYVILFQTFAFLQLFNLVNVRRPSYKDLNPLSGISLGTAIILIFLLGFQFSLVYIPRFAGFGSINEW